MTENKAHEDYPEPHRNLSWFKWALLCVFFAPPIRLPGEIPLRIDDLLIAGVGSLMVVRWLFRLHLPRPTWVSVCLVLMIVTMPLSAFFANRVGTLPIGPKEYLDFIRPAKFLFLFLALQESDGYRALQTLRWSLRFALPILVACALIQFFLTPDSGGMLARGFLFFTELPPEQAQSYYGVRPFATFHTPTDLGFVATILLAESLTMPARHRWWSGAGCVVCLTLSNTRTFLFALPLLFALATLMSEINTFKKLIRICWSFVAIGMIGALIFVVGPAVNPSFSANITRTTNAIATGDYASDDSIAVRLHKLELVEYTWANAPFFGVGSRELLGPAADSEYVFTFHRYGLLGISLTLILYIAGIKYIRRLLHGHRQMSQFTALVLFTTFIYGFTQGALINTRTGILPIATIGIAAAISRKKDADLITTAIGSQEIYREDLSCLPNPSAS